MVQFCWHAFGGAEAERASNCVNTEHNKTATSTRPGARNTGSIEQHQRGIGRSSRSADLGATKAYEGMDLSQSVVPSS